jgi:hypothetical protein
METQLSGGASGQGRDYLFIAVQGGSRVARGGWLAAVVQILCFGFYLIGEAMRRSVAER